jgi:hypothetical protein
MLDVTLPLSVQDPRNTPNAMSALRANRRTRAPVLIRCDELPVDVIAYLRWIRDRRPMHPAGTAHTAPSADVRRDMPHVLSLASRRAYVMPRVRQRSYDTRTCLTFTAFLSVLNFIHEPGSLILHVHRRAAGARSPVRGRRAVCRRRRRARAAPSWLDAARPGRMR